MTSLLSFSQTGINKDSLICIPRGVLVEVITDLSLCDLYKEEVESLKQDTTELNEIIFYRDFIISRRDEEIKAYQSTLDSCNVSRASLEAQNQTLKTQLEENQTKITSYRRTMGVLSLFVVSLFAWEINENK
jgi:hypothetical protein